VRVVDAQNIIHRIANNTEHKGLHCREPALKPGKVLFNFGQGGVLSPWGPGEADFGESSKIVLDRRGRGFRIGDENELLTEADEQLSLPVEEITIESYGCLSIASVETSKLR
jgi:hypothetical protein